MNLSHVSLINLHKKLTFFLRLLRDVKMKLSYCNFIRITKMLTNITLSCYKTLTYRKNYSKGKLMYL